MFDHESDRPGLGTGKTIYRNSSQQVSEYTTGQGFADPGPRGGFLPLSDFKASQFELVCLGDAEYVDVQLTIHLYR